MNRSERIVWALMLTYFILILGLIILYTNHVLTHQAYEEVRWTIIKEPVQEKILIPPGQNCTYIQARDEPKSYLVTCP